MTDHSGHAASIAIVGLAGRFPGARNVDELWRILAAGREATTWLGDSELIAAGVSEDDLAQSNYVKAAMVLPDMEMFDAGFFGFSPREAAILDPQHRHFLETCWEALEDAGHVPRQFPGAIGVFGGCGMQAYMAEHLMPNAKLRDSVGMFLLRHTGNDKDFLTTRVSYLLDLKGPSVGVQTACSTSLVAVHIAAQSLLAGECDMALAGGVSIELPHRVGYIAAEGEILSPTGHCAAFDDGAQGTVFGSGAAVLVLRRLEDAIADGDCIRAVIRGTAINNDGASKAGYLAPSVDGQSRAAAEAIAIADVSPSSIDYIEAHGTGTVIGDPIELSALTQAYGSDLAPGSIGVGSIKTNIGHLDTAAGAASLIKVVLGMERGLIPASLNYRTPNSRFAFEKSPFAVVGRERPWLRRDGPRRAAVNSLGVGGTNAHAILEEAPVAAGVPTQDDEPGGFQLLTLSAKTPEGLDGLAAKWQARLADGGHPFALADAAYTTQIGREAFPYRLAIAARTRAGLAEALETPNVRRAVRGHTDGSVPEIVFMFPGGGAQYPGAARGLYASQPAFREAADQCLALMPEGARDLGTLLFGTEATSPNAAQRLEHPLYSILAVFTVSYAMARTWESLGVVPAAVIGHSAGDYAAAVVAGVMSLADAVALVALRGQIFAELPQGGMLSVELGEADLRRFAGADLDIAVLNGPALSVVSGDTEAIDALKSRLDAQGVDATRVRIGVAAHSRMLDPFLERFRARLAQLRLAPAKLPMISSLTGTWGEPGDFAKPEHWVRHLREAVRFGDGIAAVIATPGRILLEVGPGQGLSALAKMAAGAAKPRAVVASTRSAMDPDDDGAVLAIAVGHLWANGVSVDLAALRGPAKRRRVPLPTYAFERKRHWIERPTADARAVTTSQSTGRARSGTVRRLARPMDWVRVPVLVPEPLPLIAGGSLPVPGQWLVFTDGSALATAAVGEMTRRKAGIILVEAGSRLDVGGKAKFVIDPADATHYRELAAEIDRRGLRIDGLLHFWSLAGDPTPRHATADLTRGFDSVLALLQAVAHAGWEHPVRLGVVTSGAMTTPDLAARRPANATLLGPVRVWPREAPGARAVLIDVPETAAVEGDLGAAIADELLSLEATDRTVDTLVVLRGRQRLVERFEPAAAATAAPNVLETRIKRGGAYLITGGLGGIGRLLARHLAENYDAQLVLVGRRDAAALDAEQQADLARLGDQAMWLTANVADEAAMGRAIASARERFGRLDGIFHAAGAMDDAPLATKTLASARAVLEPKVQGGLVLDRLLPPGSIDLFAVFSSTSAIVGPPGQIDYVGANAFLDALAASRSDGLAIDWGIWRDTGMAVRPRTEAAGPRNGAVHPLLGQRMPGGADATRYQTVLDPARVWTLLEHVVGSTPVLPGTGYIEMALAAVAQAMPGRAAHLAGLELENALQVPFGTVRTVTTEVRPMSADTAAIDIASTPGTAGASMRHFRAEAQFGPLPAAGTLGEWDAAHKQDVAEADLIAQKGVVDFGPRWTCITAIQLADGRARGRLELAAPFAGDLVQHSAHPALLDMAATVGLHLVSAAERNRHLFVPARIASVTAWGPLPRHLVADARLVDHESGRRVVFDVLLADATGTVVMSLTGLELRAVDRSAFADTGDEAGANAFLSQLLAQGIRASEAPRLFDTALAARGRRIVVSSLAIDGLERLYSERARAEMPAQAAKAAAPAAPAGSAMSATEQAVAGLFGELLGLETVGPDAEFLALGGHSLAAVRLFARIRRQLGADLGMSTLFEAPSVRRLAAVIDEVNGITSVPPAGTAAANAELPATAPARLPRRNPRQWSPLVEISAGQPGQPIVFFIHGAMGNIISSKPLADRLHGRYPIYALQAQGIDGRLPPLEKVEDMAVKYLAAMREVDPVGPYNMLGYSGGGVIGYEIARQAELTGQKVTLLAMIDSLAPTHAHGTSLMDWVRHARKHGLSALLEQAKSGVRSRFERLSHKYRPINQDATTDDELVHNSERVFDAYIEAQKHYLVRPYAGDIVLFRAARAGIAFEVAGPTLGWSDHIGERVDVHVMDADHSTIIEIPAVHDIADVIGQRLSALAAAKAGQAPSESAGPPAAIVEAEDPTGQPPMNGARTSPIRQESEPLVAAK